MAIALGHVRHVGATTERPWTRRLIIGVALGWLGLFLLLPLLTVFVEATRQGLAAFIEAIVEPDALAAIRRQTFDGILLDANLHGRSSAPVADALLDRAVPYLLVTGYGSHEEDPPAFKAAPRIAKPFTLEDLANGMTAAFGVSQACR